MGKRCSRRKPSVGFRKTERSPQRYDVYSHQVSVDPRSCRGRLGSLFRFAIARPQPSAIDVPLENSRVWCPGLVVGSLSVDRL
jgi:hypothetical protein